MKIISGSRILCNRDGKLVQVTVGTFSIEFTESGMLEPLVEIEGVKIPLWLFMQSLDIGSFAIDEASARLLSRNLKKVTNLKELTGLSLLECKASLTMHNWDMALAVKALFTALRNRGHGWS